MTPLRILVLENEPSSRRGGQEISLLEVCTGLARRGNRVTLAYHTPGDLLESYARAGVATLEAAPYDIDRRTPIRSVARWARGMARVMGVDADVVYINQYHDSLFAGTLARLRRLPLVCHMRLFPPVQYCGQWQLGLPAVGRFIASSHAVRDACIAQGYEPSSIDVVYNGIDLRRFQPSGERRTTRAALGIPAEAFTAIYTGRLDPPKDLETLLHAFATLGAGADAARLLIVGSPVNFDGPREAAAYLASLQSLAHALGIGESVHWLGRRDDLPQLYTASDACVLFSKEPESFGRLLAEAMACGTPAAARALGGVVEVLGGEFSRFLFTGDSPESGAQALRSLQDWRTRDPGLGARARAYATERFDAERMVEGVERVLQKAIDGGAERRGPSFAQLRRVRGYGPVVERAPSPVGFGAARDARAKSALH